MKVVVRRSAAADLEALFTYIAADNPAAAANMVWRIMDRLRRMAELDFGDMGRRGRSEGTRELVEAPYVISCRVDRSDNTVTVLAIKHGAQRR
jgi:plasmid stabilization system protein ParE